MVRFVIRWDIYRLPALLLLALLLVGCKAVGNGHANLAEPPFERVSDGKRVGFNEMLADFSSARLVFIGELHDNRGHHQLQLDTIKALHRGGIKLAIGVEMFRAESQKYLDLWVAGKLDLLDFVDIYRDNWTIPWEYYDSIFLYARNNGIPIIGLNAPKDIMQKVYRQGFDALSTEDRKLLPPEISCSIDKQYMDFVRRNFVMHTTDQAMFLRFCEAQLLRNRIMAYRLARYLVQEPDRMLVVLTGVGHAMRRGVPDEMEAVYPNRMRILMPLLHDVAAEPLQKGDMDYILRK